RMSRLVVSAVRALELATNLGELAGGGLVVGHGLATLEANDLYYRRIREHGAQGAEPRRFPATSPNACAGECAIAFRLTGPTFAVGASLHGGLEALGVARDLVAVGDSDRMLVVAADLGGPVSSALLDAAGARPLLEGACAALLSALPSSGSLALLSDVPRSLLDGASGAGADWIWQGPSGHRELVGYLTAIGSCLPRC
ncbi:MAG TPA: beta-ketoacyl synthase N-terminal-like domain-containing protein, partial [Polyangiaceae bacterium]|nr:beta-ketoacyl synthase N-terminal-like domain-containing protein [Polyangiaceae bacterium]